MGTPETREEAGTRSGSAPSARITLTKKSGMSLPVKLMAAVMGSVDSTDAPKSG